MEIRRLHGEAGGLRLCGEAGVVLDDDRAHRPHLGAAQDGASRQQRIHAFPGTGQGQGPGAEVIDVSGGPYPACVQENDVLEQVLHLVDEVRGDDDGAGVFGVVGEQEVVEQGAGRGVHAEVRFVEDRDGRAGGSCDQDGDG